MSYTKTEFDEFLKDIFGIIPPHDIYLVENENGLNNNLIFDFAIAGYDIDKVSISIQNNILNVKYERDKNPVPNSSYHYIKNKITKGDFNLAVKIPSGYSTDENDIVAEYKNGILRIKVPQVAERQEITNIKINR